MCEEYGEEASVGDKDVQSWPPLIIKSFTLSRSWPPQNREGFSFKKYVLLQSIVIASHVLFYQNRAQWAYLK